MDVIEGTLRDEEIELSSELPTQKRIEERERADAVDSVLSPTESGAEKAIPLSRLLSRDFISVYGGEPLPTSYSIFDHCLVALNAKTDRGKYHATSIDDLLSSFQPLLAPEILAKIRVSWEALQSSTLGPETALIQRKASILQTILHELKLLAYGPLKYSNNKCREKPEVRQRGRRAMRGRGSAGIGRGGQNEGGRGNREGAEGKEDTEEKDERKSLPGAQIFQQVTRVNVDLDEYTIPPREVSNEEMNATRRWSIAERARSFATASMVKTGHHPYNPFFSVDGFVTLYHGTRHKLSQGFSHVGIRPQQIYTEFSPTPAFYLTNEVPAAFEFPLHNRMAEDPQDTIAVFRFRVDVEVLHGEKCAPGGNVFKVRWFRGGQDDTQWKAFCEENMYGKRHPFSHRWDIVIGALCFPDSEAEQVIPRPGDMVQVAFCSESSWRWIESCLETMFIERA